MNARICMKHVNAYRSFLYLYFSTAAGLNPENSEINDIICFTLGSNWTVPALKTLLISNRRSWTQDLYSVC